MHRGGGIEAEIARKGMTGPRPAPRGTPAAVPGSLVRPRPVAPAYDVIILGAGCAGLSSCLALLDAGVTGPILLIDSRIEYRDDRTWCFWDVEPTPFTHLARSRWTTWQVRNAEAEVRATAPDTPYVCLAANDFYAFALARIAAYPNVQLRLGERAGAVRDVDEPGGAGGETGRPDLAGLVEVATAAGTLWARQVVDSRGLSLSSPEVAAARAGSTWVPQQFVGLHIVADRPVFDPGECRLMDFAVDQSQGLRFMYVLPSSPFEALVENVYMCERRLDAEGYRREIDAYLLAEFALADSDFEVLGEERGYIPMTDHRFVRRRSPRVTALGVAGGATRPSTGYTFLGIQRASRELVERLVGEPGLSVTSGSGGEGVGGRRDSGGFGGEMHAAEPACSLLDAVFLRFLADNPGRAPQVFGLLFGRVETGSLVRFLTERSGILDHARLILALPKLPFLASAARVLVDSLRRAPAGRAHARRR